MYENVCPTPQVYMERGGGAIAPVVQGRKLQFDERCMHYEQFTNTSVMTCNVFLLSVQYVCHIMC